LTALLSPFVQNHVFEEAAAVMPNFMANKMWFGLFKSVLVAKLSLWISIKFEYVKP